MSISKKLLTPNISDNLTHTSKKTLDISNPLMNLSQNGKYKPLITYHLVVFCL
jgi:hypothetical protein